MKKKLKAPTPQTHIRRCHVCGTTTEADGAHVKVCSSCGKHMAPFYFFDDQKVAPHSDFALRPERPDGKVRPVLGLTAYW
jgi:hypothetical protein